MRLGYLTHEPDSEERAQRAKFKADWGVGTTGPQLGREAWQCAECGREITALGYYDSFGNEVAPGQGEPLMGCPTHGASAGVRVREIPAETVEAVPGSEGKRWRPWKSRPDAPKEVRAGETVRAELERYREAIDAVLELHPRVLVALESEAGRVVNQAVGESMHRQEQGRTLSRAYGNCYEAVRSAGSVTGDLSADLSMTMHLLRSLRHVITECEAEAAE